MNFITTININTVQAKTPPIAEPYRDRLLVHLNFFLTSSFSEIKKFNRIAFKSSNYRIKFNDKDYESISSREFK